MFLLTAKRDGLKKQIKADEYQALNLVRRAMSSIQSMDETSLDLKAIKLIETVKSGKPQGITDVKNGGELVIQLSA